MPTPRVLFVLADGARARFVERSPESGRFVTVHEVDGRNKLRDLRSELRANLPARGMDQSCPGGHAVYQQDFLRDAKEAFAADVAGSAAAMLQKRSYAGVYLAAPARLIAILRRGLAGKAVIAGELHRDLTKAPDAELERWLPTRPMSLAMS